MKPASQNFGFLANRYTRLEAVAANAERDWSHDPVGSLIRQRLFAELLAHQVAAKLRVMVRSTENFNNIVEEFERRSIPSDAIELFQSIRKPGNDAAHRAEGNARDALAGLRLAHQLGIWFHRTFHDPAFKASAFVTPEDPNATLKRLEAAIAAAEKRAQDEADAARAARAEAERVRAAAEHEILARMLAEERADKEAADRAVWEQMAQEAEKAAQSATQAPDAEALIEGFLQRAAEAAKKIKLSEADVRRGIDQSLRAIGWQADSTELSWSKGARPEANVDRAIAEWPTADGVADYVLFVGTRPVAIIEAKRLHAMPADALTQAERYARAYTVRADETLEGGPWGDFNIPLVFGANGRPYLKQLETSTGVWIRDVRDPKNKPRALHGWPSPGGIKALLEVDVKRAHDALAKSPIETLKLRGYQNEAILAVESALARGADRCLVAMATGTGKTRTAIGLIYRLIEAERFRRVLFLVDRSALGEQTADVIKDYKVASEKTFAQIFGFKELADAKPDGDTCLHIATVQAMMRRVLDGDGDEAPAVDTYDCIVVDECHRGYTLDRDMSEEELTFRDQRDYVSRYRKVIDYFDSAKIALTATPALHTVDIFGKPVFRYTYARAVLDKVLVPQEPPYQIVTELSREGIKWRVGDKVTTYDRDTRALDTATLPDELGFEVEAFNQRVKVGGFNKAICEQIAAEIDPSLDEKTLVFCVDDEHATEVTTLLQKAFDTRWKGVDHDVVAKITGSVDRPLDQIKRFRNERRPSVVVTVDLLTTGIDVPRIANLVFMRRVRSRILYEQMLGRATRLCPEINKECFRVFDAVRQTEAVGDRTDMKPTAVTPSFTFQQLSRELLTTPDERAREVVRDQLLAKLRRKRTALERNASDEFERAAGMTPADLINDLSAMNPSEVAAWLVEHPEVVGLADRVSGVDKRVYVHEGEDCVVEVKPDFDGKRPDDYLEAFGRFIEGNLNRIPALLAVKTAPSDLTRKQLTELAEALDAAGFSEIKLQTAWKKKTNDDIAATIIGHVRQRALGEALVPYATRVDRAVKKMVSARAWTRPQRTWLERIGKQLSATTVLDRAALDEEPFRDHGGFDHVNTVFDGRAEEVLRDLCDAVWRDVG